MLCSWTFVKHDQFHISCSATLQQCTQDLCHVLRCPVAAFTVVSSCREYTPCDAKDLFVAIHSGTAPQKLPDAGAVIMLAYVIPTIALNALS
jgi:hypothetical protein